MLRIFTILFTLLLLSPSQFAQDRAIMGRDGEVIKHKGNLKNQEVNKVKGVNRNILYPMSITSSLGASDTLNHNDLEWNSNFGFFGQDWMVQWYEAPGDLNILQVGLACYANDDNLGVEVKLVKCNWTKDEFLNAGITRWGYYESTGDGFNNITAFLDNPERTGGWTAITPLPPSGEPFGEDLWSDAGVGFPYVPTGDGADPYYEWVDMSLLEVPSVSAGEIFGIAVKHNGTNLDQVSERIGWWASSDVPSYYAHKFYSTYRIADDNGWWSREFTWNFVAEVEYTSDTPPVISDVTELGTTLSNSDREVQATITDVNPIGSTPGGVSAAVIQWSIDDGATWNDAAMSNIGGDVFSGNIPGQAAGINVSYRIMATDDNSNSSNTLPKSYFIFIKQNDVLFIYNTGDFARATARRLYIGNLPNTNSYIVDPVNNDVWLSTDGTAEAADVMSLYNWVVQIDGSYPDDDFSDAVKAYLDGASAGNERNYFLSSQDYGCYITGNCADITFAAGDFQYDYLGVETLGPQDLSGAIVGLTGVSGDPLSGWVDDYATTNTVGFYYDPSYELGFTSYIDALTPTSGATAIFTSDGQTVGVRNEGENWKTAFVTFDYAAANFRSDTSVADHSDPGYAWGITVENQALKFFEWAGYVLDVEQTDDLIPVEYTLSQNYPNPFNPTTNIKFSVPQSSFVSLKVYDVLGKEVATLINQDMKSGNYIVDFNASNLASGLYIYKIQAGDFTSSKKMMLLK